MSKLNILEMKRMNMENKIKSVKKEDIEKMNKESKIILFLFDSDKKSRDEILKLYLEKYNLSNKSGNFNNRVINRLFGVDSKYSDEKKKGKEKVLKEEMKRLNIDYGELIKRKNYVLEMMKRKNVLNKNYENLKLF